MTTALQPNTVLRAESVRMHEVALDAADVVCGEPMTRIAELAVIDDVGVGVWEVTPGIVTDTEADEVFVVISGSAVVEFENSDCILHLSAGTIGRLQAGTRTRWTVTETLRKVYFTLPETPVGARATLSQEATSR